VQSTSVQYPSGHRTMHAVWGSSPQNSKLWHGAPTFVVESPQARVVAIAAKNKGLRYIPFILRCIRIPIWPVCAFWDTKAERRSRKMFPRVRFFLVQAWLGLSRSLGVTLLTAATIGLTLAILVCFEALVTTLSDAAERLGERIQVSAYLDASAADTTGPEMAREAAGWPEVQRAEYLSSHDALEAFRQDLGRDAVIVDGLPDGVLPPSVEMVLAPDAWSLAEVQKFAERLEARPEVREVRYGQDDLARVASVLKVARALRLGLGFGLSLAATLIIFNAIRLAVYARRDEIEIMSLVGATPGFVRVPFLLEGAFQGLLGAVTAFLGIFLVNLVFREAVEEVLASTLGPLGFSFSPLAALVYLPALGLVLGLAGSGFAVGRFLRF
jgi:cell division transport system permease protein